MDTEKHTHDAVLSKEVNVAASETSATSTLDPEAQQAKIYAAQRKVDYRLFLWYCFVYLIMRINVSNITNTAIMNEEQGDDIKTQLGNLSSSQWAWALSIFYYPYAAFEPASTLLLKRFKPNIWMSRIMVTWGAISMCQAATQNYSGILACRFFLGLAEAGYYPGVLYHLSFWFPADNMALRIAFFYACGQFSGTISGLLAYGVSFLNGHLGLAGWRHTGNPVCSLHFLPTPQLPGRERKVLDRARKTNDFGVLAENATNGWFQDLGWCTGEGAAAGSHIPAFTMIWVFHAIGGWGIGTVLPTVIYELGLTDTAVSQLMTMPAYAFGCSALVFWGWMIRTKRLTSWGTAIGLETFACICYIVLITVDIPIVKYIFVTLALACSISIYPIIWPERIRAAHGTTAAALGIGLTNAAAQLQGIVGPQVYQPKFGPGYKVSFCCSIGLLAGAIASISATWYLVAKKDRSRQIEAALAEEDRGNAERHNDEKI